VTNASRSPAWTPASPPRHPPPAPQPPSRTTSALPLFVAATIVAGAGQGIAISAATRGVLLADRAPIFAVVYLLSYSSATIPGSSPANCPECSRYRRSPSGTAHLQSLPPCSPSSQHAIRTPPRPATLMSSHDNRTSAALSVTRPGRNSTGDSGRARSDIRRCWSDAARHGWVSTRAVARASGAPRMSRLAIVAARTPCVPFEMSLSAMENTAE
jgi:hypothetical protein